MNLNGNFPELAQRINEWLVAPGFKVTLKDSLLRKIFVAYLNDLDCYAIGNKLKNSLDNYDNTKEKTLPKLRWKKRSKPVTDDPVENAEKIANISVIDLISPQPSPTSSVTFEIPEPVVRSKPRKSRCKSSSDSSASVSNKQDVQQSKASDLKLKLEKSWKEDRYRSIGRKSPDGSSHKKRDRDKSKDSSVRSSSHHGVDGRKSDHSSEKRRKKKPNCEETNRSVDKALTKEKDLSGPDKNGKDVPKPDKKHKDKHRLGKNEKDLSRPDKKDKDMPRLEKNEAKDLSRPDKKERDMPRLDKNEEKDIPRPDKKERDMPRLEKSEEKDLPRPDKKDKDMPKLDKSEEKDLSRPDKKEKDVSRLDKKDKNVPRLDKKEKDVSRLDKKDKNVPKPDKKERDKSKPHEHRKDVSKSDTKDFPGKTKVQIASFNVDPRLGCVLSVPENSEPNSKKETSKSVTDTPSSNKFLHSTLTTPHEQKSSSVSRTYIVNDVLTNEVLPILELVHSMTEYSAVMMEIERTVISNDRKNETIDHPNFKLHESTDSVSYKICCTESVACDLTKSPVKTECSNTSPEFETLMEASDESPFDQHCTYEFDNCLLRYSGPPLKKCRVQLTDIGPCQPIELNENDEENRSTEEIHSNDILQENDDELLAFKRTTCLKRAVLKESDINGTARKHTSPLHIDMFRCYKEKYQKLKEIHSKIEDPRKRRGLFSYQNPFSSPEKIAPSHELNLNGGFITPLRAAKVDWHQYNCNKCGEAFLSLDNWRVHCSSKCQ